MQPSLWVQFCLAVVGGGVVVYFLDVARQAKNRRSKSTAAKSWLLADLLLNRMYITMAIKHGQERLLALLRTESWDAIKSDPSYYLSPSERVEATVVFADILMLKGLAITEPMTERFAEFMKSICRSIDNAIGSIQSEEFTNPEDVLRHIQSLPGRYDS